jgi:hypothetical protein
MTTTPPIITYHAPPEDLTLGAIPAPAPSVRLTSCRVDDEVQTTLYAFVQFGANPTYAECWAVTRGGAARFIGRTPPSWGKVDSATPEYFPDGTVRLSCSVAEPGGSGSTSTIKWEDFAGALSGLDAHGKDLIYNRVTTPSSGTYGAIRSLAREEANIVYDERT